MQTKPVQKVLFSPLISGLLMTLNQYKDVIKQAAQYYSLERETGSTIGMHVRHVIEHFDEFFNGLTSGQMDYESRQREKVLEKSTEHALNRINTLTDQISSLKTDELLELLTLVESPHADAEKIRHTTSVSRELTFLNMHAIHHMALVKEILRGFDLELDHEIGRAPATIKSETGKV